MKKIPTMFERDWNGDRSRVLDKPHPDCAWVFAGEGVATRKLDGTSCMVNDEGLWKRRELRGNDLPPPGFLTVGHDEETGKTVGWIPVGDGPEDKFHREAWDRWTTSGLPIAKGTYELVGPKVQGNPEKWESHGLVYHGGVGLILDPQPPRTFDGLRDYLAGKDIEGVVFHHPDGRMAKIKLRDFGLKRVKAAA